MSSLQEFEQKLEELISRSIKVYDITKEVIEKDHKVLVGLKEAPKDVLHFGILFTKPSNGEEKPISPFQEFLGGDSVNPFNTEQLIFNFSDLKRKQDQTVVRREDGDIVAFGNTIKVKLFEEGRLSVQYKGLDILETSNIETLNQLYKHLILKEKEINQGEAAKHREYLMSL